MEMRLSDFVIGAVAAEGVKHIFMVSGGGGMFLIDSLGRNEQVQHVCNHHEQASAIAAEGYQRITGNLGTCLVTTGPAGTNTLTGVLCAWNDSIPVLYLSGQAKSTFLIDDTGLRQRGVHEANITKIVESVTKYAVTVRDETRIKYHVEKAIYLARHGRPGPVWLDVPLDIQSKTIDPDQLSGFDPEEEGYPDYSGKIAEISQVKALLQQARRPIIIAGHGIRLANAMAAFQEFISKYQIPVVTTKNGMDLMYDAHPLLAGRMGNYGQRAGNFAVQNSDLVISLGSRLPFPAVGYQTEWFARAAKKVMVDIDERVLEWALIDVDLPVHAEVKEFLHQLSEVLGEQAGDYSEWVYQCHRWRERYPPVLPEWKKEEEYVNPYYFFEVLSEEMGADDILVTDQGATFYASTVAFKLKKGQRLFTNGGFSPMGYGLPAAVGACYGHGKRRVFCAHGDGGLQLNIQELQTMFHNQLPIKLFVFNNEGYLSIKHTQTAYFNGFFVGCDPSSGLSCPDILKIAQAYGIKGLKLERHGQMREVIQAAMAVDGPVIIEVMIDPMQPYMPRVSSKKRADGSMVSKPLEDMWPFLDRDEFREQMIIKPVEEDK